MAYPPDDHFSGRDASIAHLYKTLKATKVDEDFDSIDIDRVPYFDLQRSPNGVRGLFTHTYDEGSFDICAHEGYTPHVVARMKIRNVVRSDGRRETLVSIELAGGKVNGNGNSEYPQSLYGEDMGD